MGPGRRCQWGYPDPYHGVPPHQRTVPRTHYPGYHSTTTTVAAPPARPASTVSAVSQRLLRVRQASSRYSPWSTLVVYADTSINDHIPALMTTSGKTVKTDRKRVENSLILVKLRKVVFYCFFTVLVKRTCFIPCFLCAVMPL